MIHAKPQNISKNIALGHTRYITNGILTQPLEKDGITLVHNGHIKELESENKSDSQLLLEYIIKNKKGDMIDTIKNVIQNIESSYFVILIYQDTIYAFKDRYGIRPGLYGIKGDDIIISSENNKNTYIDKDIEAGEIMMVKEGKIYKYQTKNCFQSYIFEFLYFSRPSSTVYGLSVRDFRINLAGLSEKMIKNPIDVVCGIPSSSRVYGL